MSTRRAEIPLWVAAVILALLAMRGYVVGPDARGIEPLPIPRAAAVPVLLDADSLAKAAIHAVERDPFRLERRPSDVPYVPGVESAPPPPPEPPKPALVLSGILGGPPWQAVVEGIPGTNGSTVVRQGQLFGELRVVRVAENLVVVKSADTTWTLRLRGTW